MAEQQKQSKNVGLGTLITFALICVGVYIWVSSSFPQTITCKEGVKASICECIRFKISKNVSFLDKLKIMITGASEEEINSYVDMQDNLSCVLAEIGK